MNPKHAKLFQALTFKKGVTISNRLIMAPMTTWASNDDYTISDDEVKHYHKRVKAVGLVITGCTRVAVNGIGFTNEFAGYDDNFIPSLKKLATAAKKGGAPAILQIFHAGIRAIPNLIPGEDLVSASAFKIDGSFYSPNNKVTRALTHEEILDIVCAFGETTRRAIEAGFDGVELHGAHGFLIQNFLSPLFNQRTDEWGGSLEKRLRFPLAVVKEIKRVIQEHSTKPFLFGYRVSPEEPLEGGLRLNDVYVLLDNLIKEKIDYIHVSLVNLLTDKPINNSDNKTIIELILNRVNGNVPVIAAGGIRKPDDAVKALDLGLSMVALAKALVMNPNWVELTREGRVEEIETALSISKVKEKAIPVKLLNYIKSAKGWFDIAA
ncbi:MAG TPA: NADH-dependent flavin oxidoreductase [Cyclobacteriaceae bacterium]|jgi:2,4-dienoyl-CoA reductase-like NADH-dependent reductase (Old Yellow Enzyme family)|nr:NADH-dependent flavin oxidoreductase [Cyclobacteriaceae bacterium]